MSINWLAATGIVVAAASAHATSWTINVKSFDFSPQFLTVTQGDTVKWSNMDIAPHSVKSGTSFTFDGNFQTGTVNPGTTSSPITFNTVGTFFYFCSIHTSGMAHGNNYSITVQAPTSTLSGNVSLDSLAASPTGMTATLELRTPSTTTVVFSTTITLDASGNFSASGAPVGTFDVAVKFLNWLRQVLPSVAVSAPTTTGLNFSEAAGDGNNDNTVNLLDLSSVLANFNVSATPPSDGDLNWDGTVNLLDLSTVLSNFNMTGQP